MNSFWQTYSYFSLKTPWVIGPESDLGDSSGLTADETRSDQKETQVSSEPVVIETHKPLVFILGLQKGDEDVELMVSKMIKAIGQSEDSVHCHWIQGPLKASSFSPLNSEQKVFVFGKQNIYGQTKTNSGVWFPIGKSGLQAMATFDLRDLQVNSKLKRQTWEHLKAFVGMS